MTPTVDSVIPFASAANPVAYADSPNSSTGSGISFADICNAELSRPVETHVTAPATTSASDSSPKTGNRASTPVAKNSAKNTSAAGASPVLAVFVPLPVPLAIPVNSLLNSPIQAAGSLLADDAANLIGGGSNGTFQSTNLAPAVASTTTPALTPGNANVSSIAIAIPSRTFAADPLPEVPGSASTPAEDPWPVSPAANPTPAVASSGSTSLDSSSLLGNGIGTQDSVLEPTDAADNPTPSENSAAANEFFAPNAQIGYPTSVRLPINTPDNAEQAACNLTPVAKLSPGVVHTLSTPEVPEQDPIQFAAISSTQPEQTAPADQKAPARPVIQAGAPLEQKILCASSLPGASALPPTSLESRAAPDGTQPALSAPASPTPAHAISSSVPTTTPVLNPQSMSTARDNFNNALHPANASVSILGTQAPATGGASSAPASSPKKDSDGESSDSDQQKDSPNVAVASVGSPTFSSPAFTIATPSAQVNVPQPSSVPDAGPKPNPHTSAVISENAHRSILPGSAETFPAAGTSPLRWVQIANKAGQAEMRIGLNTAEFGSVEVRTTVHASDVGVLIGSEKGDLRSLLTPELPGITSTLQRHDLQLAQLSFHQQGFAFAGNSSFSGGHSQPRSYSSRPQPTAAYPEDPSGAEPTCGSEPVGYRRVTGLSILA